MLEVSQSNIDRRHLIPSIDNDLKKRPTQSELLKEVAYTPASMLSSSLQVTLQPSHPLQRKRAIVQKTLRNAKNSSVDSNTVTKVRIHTANQTSSNSTQTTFWNEYTLELSKKLFNCTDADCLDLPAHSWDSSAKRLLTKSSFTVRQARLNPTTKKTMESLSIVHLLMNEIVSKRRQHNRRNGANLQKAALYRRRVL